MIQDFNQILGDLKKKIFHPVYFLFGEESYYIDEVVEYIEQHALTESEKAFNQTVVYGKDVEVGQVMDSAKRLPMMANYQVVIVKEAQQLKSIENLSGYLAHINPSTLLVLAFKHQSPDKRKSFFKEIINHKQVVSLESKGIKDYEVTKWIETYAKKEGLKISPKGVEMLAEFLGTDIKKIVNELDKLVLVKGKNADISEEDIEKNIGASKDYNIFEFTNALGIKNTEKIYKILRYFEQNPKSLVLPMALGNMGTFLQKVYLTKFASGMSDAEFGSLLKMHPFVAKEYKKYAQNYSVPQLERAIEMLGDYDLKSKGLGNKSASDSELLTEMTYKILAL